MIRHIAPICLALLTLALTALIFALPTPAPTEGPEAISGTLIENVRIVTEYGSLSEPISILIKNGAIDSIGSLQNISADTIIDGTGLTALPGLIDSHTHTYGTALEDAARFGITTLLDMFTDPRSLEDTRTARDTPSKTQKADLFSAGMLATAPRGHGTQFGIKIETLTAPDQAEDWVAARIAEGSDYIKLVYMPGFARLPSISRETAKAIIEAGHAQGLLVVAHISTHDAAAEMIEDGIDGLVHIFADRMADDALLKAAKANNIFIVPTLSVIASVDADNSIAELRDQQARFLSPSQSLSSAARFGQAGSGFSLEIAFANVAAFHKAGIPILAGSDAPNPGTAHGLSLHHEMQLLTRAGLQPAEAIAAATTRPAQVFGLNTRGKLETGARADLVLIKGNPLKNINATLDITHIFKNGHMLDRAIPEAPSAEAVSGDILGDFETGITSLEGLSWTETTDAVAGGASTARLTRLEGGAQGSSHALKIETSVKRGFPFPWAGASIGLSQTNSTGPIDISGYAKISFDMKGTPGTYRVMGFNPGAQGIPPTQTVEAIETWQTFTLDIADFAGLQADNLFALAFVAGPGFGDSTIYLDNVRLVK